MNGDCYQGHLGDSLFSDLGCSWLSWTTQGRGNWLIEQGPGLHLSFQRPRQDLEGGPTEQEVDRELQGHLPGTSEPVDRTVFLY